MAATIMEEPSDGVHEKQKHRMRQTPLAFGNEQTTLSSIDDNNINNNSNNNNNNNSHNKIAAVLCSY